ncbi:MAG: hypothetical protein GJ680_07765 [Alteromonadaceae bacterium]|nr:hypothetical protein [Alteromonadaceae bacterium]
MLYQVSDIKDHDKKVEILKADPEYIRRYRNRSFEMIATAIEGDVLLASELLQGMDQDSVFLFAKAIAIGVNQFTKTNRYHTSERLCQTARLLEGYTFSDQEQALLLDEVSDLNDIDDFLVNCTFDAPLAAKVATRFGYQAFEQLVNFPDQLDAAFAEHGVYLLHQYIKKGFLTLSPALLATALEGQPVSATDFKTRDLKEVVEPVLADPDYRRVIIENGFIHLFLRTLILPKRNCYTRPLQHHSLGKNCARGMTSMGVIILCTCGATSYFCITYKPFPTP